MASRLARISRTGTSSQGSSRVTDFHKRQTESGELEFRCNLLTRLKHKLVDRKCKPANSIHRIIKGTEKPTLSYNLV